MNAALIRILSLVLILMMLFTPALLAAPAAYGLETSEPGWAQRDPANHPSARYGHALAYDAARGVTVLFGGYDNNGTLNDTWEWDGEDWVQRTPSNSPSQRYTHAMAYDSARGVAVLYGGYSGGFLDDTWEWDGDDWVQRTPSTIPPARHTHAIAYDDIRGVTVLYGGLPNLEDTWEYPRWTIYLPVIPRADPIDPLDLTLAPPRT